MSGSPIKKIDSAEGVMLLCGNLFKTVKDDTWDVVDREFRQYALRTRDHPFIKYSEKLKFPDIRENFSYGDVETIELRFKFLFVQLYGLIKYCEPLALNKAKDQTLLNLIEAKNDLIWKQLVSDSKTQRSEDRSGRGGYSPGGLR